MEFIMLINSRYSNQYLVIPLTLNLEDSLPVVIILPSHSDLVFMSLVIKNILVRRFNQSSLVRLK